METSEKVVLGVVGALASALAGVIALSVHADGRADFCYVGPMDATALVYRVEAHRPWRPDMVVGYAHDIDGALAIAAKASCRLHTEAR